MSSLSQRGGGPPHPLLEVTDLRVRFRAGRREVRAVDGMSYRVEAGETVALVGESGSGKTVSCRALIGLLPRTAIVTGSARFGGAAAAGPGQYSAAAAGPGQYSAAAAGPGQYSAAAAGPGQYSTELIGLSDEQLRRHRGADIAMVFQDPARSLNPTMKVGQQVAEAIRAHEPFTRREAADRTVELLREVHIPLPERRAAEYPHQLSGGMRQRVMIAMALACRPQLLIADEATTALDVTTQAQIMELLLELQEEIGMALLLITHDLGLAASYAGEVIVMYAGRIVEQAPAGRLLANGGHVRMPYTKALLEAVPRLELPAHAPLPVIGGRPPDLSERWPGCSFAPRCGSARDDCRQAAPPLTEHEPGHRWACWHPVNGIRHD